MPLNSFEVSVRLVLGALWEGGPAGVLKSTLRDTLERAAEEDDPAKLPHNDIEQQHWTRALDRKVERCLRSLAKDGAVITRDLAPSRRLARFTLDKGPTWDEHVAAEARLALRLAALTLAHSGTERWQQKLGIIEQLASRHMSNRDQSLFEQMEKAVKIYGGVEDPVPEGEDVLVRLLEAIQRGCKVALAYRKAGASRATTMTVVPHTLTQDIFSGGAYLLAWDSRTHTPKQYRLNRILSVQLLEEPGVIHNPEKMQRALDYQIGAWASGDPPFEVVARVQGESWISSIQEAPPALKDFSGDLEKGGRSLLVRFKANKEEGPVRWLLQFGSAVEVLEPPFLRDRIREELKATLEAYAE